jgi:hypothetical protein
VPADVAALVEELERSPLAGASKLIPALGLGSQPTLSRLVARAGERIVAIGRARARRYAAARDVRGLPPSLPLYRVTPGGELVRIAAVRAWAPRGHWLEADAPLPRWMRGPAGDGNFGALPAFLLDQRPAGFIGASFTRRHPSLELPDDPRQWSDDDCLVALASAGDDGIGDLLLGDESARRLYALWSEAPAIVAPGERARAYPAFALQAIEGATPGATLGGSQPKFAALTGDGEAARHVVVKFSSAEFSPAARRWCDLLVAEHLALAALRANGIAAVVSEIVEGGSRVFLETARFDREGLRGRRPVVTLAAVLAEHAKAPGARTGWSAAVERLRDARFVSAATRDALRVIETFGRLIANADMHHGNLSFVPQDDGTLALAPVYDMLPMAYAPIGGDVPDRAFDVPAPDPGHEDAWRRAADLATGYWRTVARDARVSQPFQGIAAANAGAIARTVARFEGKASG